MKERNVSSVSGEFRSRVTEGEAQKSKDKDRRVENRMKDDTRRRVTHLVTRSLHHRDQRSQNPQKTMHKPPKQETHTFNQCNSVSSSGFAKLAYMK